MTILYIVLYVLSILLNRWMYVKIQKFDEDGRDEWYEIHWLCVWICFIPFFGSLFYTAFYINYAPKDNILNKCLSAFKNWFKYTSK